LTKVDRERLQENQIQEAEIPIQMNTYTHNK